MRPDRVFAVVSWEEDFDADWTRFGDHVRIIAIDPATDSVVGSRDESRCNYLPWAFKATDGTAYFSPLSYYAPLRSMLGEGRGVDSCSQWWRWRIGDESATPIPDQGPAAGETTGLFAIDGRKLIPRVNADFTETTLDELDPAGALLPALTGPGNVWGITRVR